MDYYNFMTLDKPVCIAQMVCMIFQTLVAITHIQRGILAFVDDDLDYLAIGCFVCQFFVFNITMVAVTLKRIVAHLQMQDFEKDKNDAKTINGRIEVRIKRRAKKT